ncbi:hypothetical protein [Neobacillus cucumis]|uniref:hypothetical protein n=1 Tax=Neobacillus cucumis TaxID=1740721 RepID=UPI001965416C|nr:hypothetical protein [Neobacillus cucumis]MBM7656206.1 hypothetical protein [Neobacillus cucumis]
MGRDWDEIRLKMMMLRHEHMIELMRLSAISATLQSKHVTSVEKLKLIEDLTKEIPKGK